MSQSDNRLALSANLIDELTTLLSVERVSRDELDLLAYSRDTFPLAIKEVARGDLTYRPDVVVWPETTAEVAAIMRIASHHSIPVVPYGGGSGIVGGALSVQGGILLDLKKLNKLIDLDPVSQTVTVEAGALGGVFEEQLNARGYTTGHYPQSLYSSTVGGWIADRGIGTFSTKYGRMDDIVVALEAVLPDGQVASTRMVPASSAGPDLNRLFLGAEGTLGVVTAATLKIHPLPEARMHMSFAFASFAEGVECVRRVIQRDLRPAVVRLYDPVETQAQFGSLGLPGGQAVLLFVVEGFSDLVDLTERGIRQITGDMGVRELGPVVGDYWLDSRFSTAALCRTLSKPFGVSDALEVANVWSHLADTYTAMKSAMEAAIGPTGTVYGHCSHFYHAGGNLYMIFHAEADSAAEVSDKYYRILDAAFDACQGLGGTLTHHHGVGLGKGRWMPRELGDGGFDLLRRIKSAVDPAGIMNPGKLGL